MPSMGADMDAGTVVEWRVGPGDAVQRGAIVALVETDKADIEIESFQAGVIEEILVPAGERVPVGTPLARLGTGAPSGDGAGGRPRPVRVSPRARRLAERLGVDPAAVTGTGAGGSVTAADVERAAAAAAPAPPSAEREDRRAALRAATAALMARSKREIPHYYLGTHVDVTGTAAWIEEHNRDRPPAERILLAAALVRAVALAAAEVPEMNGHWRDDRLVLSREVDLALGIALRGGGLVAPVIPDVGSRSLEEVMAAMRDLVRRARGGALRAEEVGEGTITVTNLGDLGVETVYGVIMPPQVALVGFGAPLERPWAVDGMIGVRRVLHVTLSADHRASDGHRGAAFLAALADHLVRPEAL
jgi:pyruvate dehydrogenase E2 component (dihydrolipoamide acetyltransferase)